MRDSMQYTPTDRYGANGASQESGETWQGPAIVAPATIWEPRPYGSAPNGAEQLALDVQ